MSEETGAVRASRWVVDRTSRLLGSRLTRRGFVSRATMVGTAIATTGTAVLTRPGTAFGQVTGEVAPGGCGGGLCADGYTEFCCVINGGQNACPPNSIPSGWWRADFSQFCNGTRYYIDCNDYSGGGPCQCAVGCDTRRVYCNHFRYGQCNQQVGGVGVIACRVVTCVPPYELAGFNCTPSGAVDNSTANHNADCGAYASAAGPPPPAVEVQAGGMVGVGGAALVAYVRDTNGAVAYRRFDGSSWGPWGSLGGLTGSGFGTVSRAAGESTIFVRASDYTLASRTLTPSGPTPWENFGGVVFSDPAVAVRGSQIFVVVRGIDRAYWLRRFDGSTWQPWGSLGGTFTSDPVVVGNASSTWVIGRGLTNAVHWSRFDGSGWTTWDTLGGTVSSNVAAVLVGAAPMVVVRGSDAAFFARTIGSGGWTRIGGVLTSDPTLVAHGSSVLLFGRGTNSAAFWNRFDGSSWAGWSTLEGVITSDVSAVNTGATTTMFARGLDNALWLRRYDGSTWSAWESLGGQLAPTRGAHSV